MPRKLLVRPAGAPRPGRVPALLLLLSLAAGGLAHAAADAEPSISNAPTRAASSRGIPLDRIVAVVNDGTVLESQLDAETAQILERLRSQNITPPSMQLLREQVLERLILEEIQSQRADSAGIRVSDEQVNAALQDVAKQNKIDFAELPQTLAAQGIDYAAYRDSVRREIQREYLRIRDVVQRIYISPRELEDYLARQKQKVSNDFEYNISDILIEVSDNSTPAQVTAAEKKAADVLARARAGEAFDQLAVAYSNGQTALEGGSLGWRSGNNLPTFAAAAIGRMKPGDISDVLQTNTGFHILKLNDRRGGDKKQMVEQVHLRHILIKPNEVQDDATVEQRLNGIRDRILAGEDFAVLAKGVSEDTGSAIDGGDLGWQSPDTFVPEFAAVAEKLAPNEISKPFKSRYGWHIVQMLGKRDFDNTDTAARERAMSELRASRLDEATETWLQQLRDEAYVEVRL